MRRMSGLLLPVGALSIVFAVGAYHATHRTPTYRFGTQNGLGWYVLYAALHIGAAYVAGLPDEPKDVQHAFVGAIGAAGVSASLFALFQVVRPGTLPRFVVAAAPFPIAAWTVLCSVTAIRSHSTGRLRDRVLAVISAEDGATLRLDAEAEFPLPDRPFSLVSIVELSEVLATRRPRSTLSAIASSTSPTVIVLSEEAQGAENLVDEVVRLHAAGIRVRSLTAFYDEWLGKLPLSELGKMAMLFDINDLHGHRYRQMKRAIDIAGGLVGSIGLVLVSPFVAIGNVFGNRGPLIFRQKRVGRDGTIFTVFKFRTMRQDALDELMPWTHPDDPRITPFGRVLRRAHIDELPQMINVLKGNLSLVGPRPEQPQFVAELETKLAFYSLRHLVQPGLTGWAQVKYHYAATEAHAFEKLQYDLYYLRHQSLFFDWRIMGRTVRSVLWAKGH